MQYFSDQISKNWITTERYLVNVTRDELKVRQDENYNRIGLYQHALIYLNLNELGDTQPTNKK